MIQNHVKQLGTRILNLQQLFRGLQDIMDITIGKILLQEHYNQAKQKLTTNSEHDTTTFRAFQSEERVHK